MVLKKSCNMHRTGMTLEIVPDASHGAFNGRIK